MKSTLFTAGLLLTAALGASSSFAGEIGESYTGPVFSDTPSSLTREAVRAEYFAAQKNGTLPHTGERYAGPATPSSPPAATREAVRAEYFAARDHGHLPRLGEGS
ncbi:MAG: DUF4148 domain-containing protein [Rhodoferax sp.]|uniref:DUF4148 domain-containing protein n=1 Tax=Rhodoferax sp. TaxID=50421 RepID=UPI002610FBD6|nr:DUF4148 domain-containing protein [Rhodoferax sp.]MDD5332271.1 DUF4148 domain-containing protein [Rhodoferax sp.]